MAEDQKYNGWTNYETWAVNLWIDSEQGLSDDFKEQGRLAISDRYPVACLMEYMKEYFDDNNPLSEEASLYSDLLSGGLSEVNWREIAEHFIEEIEKEIEEEDPGFEEDAMFGE